MHYEDRYFGWSIRIWPTNISSHNIFLCLKIDTVTAARYVFVFTFAKCSGKVFKNAVETCGS